jgi:hypothetical protein
MMQDNVAKGDDRPRDSGIRKSGPVGEPHGTGEGLPLLLAETIGPFGKTDASAPWAAVLNSEDQTRLIAAVRRRGKSVAIDVELAADLVEAVLPALLTEMVADSRSRRRLAAQIARTLLDDPHSAARLQTLLAALVSAADTAATRQTRNSP